MSYCADTNILLRWIESGTVMCDQARNAVKALRLAGETIYITPQNLVEFWNGATRPVAANGLGLTPAQADHELSQIEFLFPLLQDNSKIHTIWRRLVIAHAISGVQVHDARLAAALFTHDVTNLLTFNGRDFGRFKGINIVSPTSFLAI